MRIYGTGAGELAAGNRLQPSYFLFSAPEGGEKTRLGGGQRREEQLVPRAGMSTDRDGTDDDLSEGVFICLSPLAPARQKSHKSRGQLKLTNLADQRPRSGWNMPRIVETSDNSYFILV
jgi:hypothetical protein